MNRQVHQLVLEAFVGLCPDGMECRHLNGVRDDNRLENLCWGTRKENQNDKIVHGNSLKGERNPYAKLSNEDVVEIKKALLLGGENTDGISQDLQGQKDHYFKDKTK